MPAVGQTVAHVPSHADTVPPLVLIGLAWNIPGAHAVQATSAVEVPGAE